VIVGLGYAVCQVQVPHNTCYAHWSGWKCSGGAGACPCSTDAFPPTPVSITRIMWHLNLTYSIT